MKSKTKMKFSVLLAGLSLMWISGFAHADSCYSQLKESDDKVHLVYDSENTYKGYIAEEVDGSWFIWANKMGALNETTSTHDEAVQKLCGITVTTEE